MRYTEEIRGKENNPSSETETSHAAALSPQTSRLSETGMWIFQGYINFYITGGKKSGWNGLRAFLCRRMFQFRLSELNRALLLV